MNWDAIGKGIPAGLLAASDWPEIAELRFALGQQITVTSTDPGLSFTIGSDR
ncbi:MAG TPA: hypothetical protein VKK31_12405 [Thermoanaerobaculia bacterium]|nr:hypothetical protein [Thermoanaerobaculia bacterium]